MGNATACCNSIDIEKPASGSSSKHGRRKADSSSSSKDRSNHDPVSDSKGASASKANVTEYPTMSAKASAEDSKYSAITRIPNAFRNDSAEEELAMQQSADDECEPCSPDITLKTYAQKRWSIPNAPTLEMVPEDKCGSLCSSGLSRAYAQKRWSMPEFSDGASGEHMAKQDDGKGLKGLLEEPDCQAVSLSRQKWEEIDRRRKEQIEKWVSEAGERGLSKLSTASSLDRIQQGRSPSNLHESMGARVSTALSEYLEQEQLRKGVVDS